MIECEVGEGDSCTSIDSNTIRKEDKVGDPRHWLTGREFRISLGTSGNSSSTIQNLMQYNYICIER